MAFLFFPLIYCAGHLTKGKVWHVLLCGESGKSYSFQYFTFKMKLTLHSHWPRASWQWQSWPRSSSALLLPYGCPMRKQYYQNKLLGPGAQWQIIVLLSKSTLLHSNGCTTEKLRSHKRVPMLPCGFVTQNTVVKKSLCNYHLEDYIDTRVDCSYEERMHCITKVENLATRWRYLHCHIAWDRPIGTIVSIGCCTKKLIWILPQNGSCCQSQIFGISFCLKLLSI